MDNLNLPSSLVLIWDLKRAIEKNLSLQVGVQRFAQRTADLSIYKDDFANNFIKWWDVRQKQQFSELNLFNAQHRALVSLIDMGLKGQSIYDALKSIEADFVEMCEADIQEHSAKLPLMLQIPLIFLVFPAICVLLLVPVLFQLAL